MALDADSFKIDGTEYAIKLDDLTPFNTEEVAGRREMVTVSVRQRNNSPSSPSKLEVYSVNQMGRGPHKEVVVPTDGWRSVSVGTWPVCSGHPVGAELVYDFPDRDTSKSAKVSIEAGSYAHSNASEPLTAEDDISNCPSDSVEQADAEPDDQLGDLPTAALAMGGVALAWWWFG